MASPSEIQREKLAYMPPQDWRKWHSDPDKEADIDSGSELDYVTEEEEQEAYTALATFLFATNMNHCHITLVKFQDLIMAPVANAYILLPKSSPKNIIRLVAFVLGAQNVSLHHRLFLMPLRIDLHWILYPQPKIFFLPSEQVIRLLVKYLQQFRLQIDDEEAWEKLLKGELQGFEELKDGNIHSYTLLCSPHFSDEYPLESVKDDKHSMSFLRPYKDLPPIRTHVSPFAMCINALRALEFHETRQVLLTSSRGSDHLDKIRDWTVCALLGVHLKEKRPEVTPQDVQSRAEAFREFVYTFDRLQGIWNTRKSNKSHCTSM